MLTLMPSCPKEPMRLSHQRASPSWTSGQSEAGYHRVPAGRASGEPDAGDVAHARRSLVGPAWLLVHRVWSAALPPHPARQAPQDHGVDDARLLPRASRRPCGRAFPMPFHPPFAMVGIGRRRGWKRSSHCHPPSSPPAGCVSTPVRARGVCRK